MIEDVWPKIIDHAISAAVQIVTTIAGVAILYLKMRGTDKKIDDNTVETVKGKVASIAAAKANIENTKKIEAVQKAVEESGTIKVT